ncbi:hypothetical protein [Amycolatopsis sp. NPDC004169]|uniref:hypothetical protein n=1 Tax=Amycolatopsis sp. NPDC004169 TaxID=3154453 RepID=UPI0033B8BA97
MKPPRRIAAVLAVVLLSAAEVATTAPPAAAVTTSYAPVPEVVTTVRWTSVVVVDAHFHRRLRMVRLTRAFFLSP